MCSLSLTPRDLRHLLPFPIKGVCISFKTLNIEHVPFLKLLKDQDISIFEYPERTTLPLTYFLPLSHSYNMLVVNGYDSLKEIEDILSTVDYVWGISSSIDFVIIKEFIKQDPSLKLQKTKYSGNGNDNRQMVEFFFGKEEEAQVIPKEIDQERLKRLFEPKQHDIFEDVIFVNSDQKHFNMDRLQKLFSSPFDDKKEEKEEIIFIKPQFEGKDLKSTNLLSKIDFRRVDSLFKNITI